MKKYTWLVALVIALSFVAVGCDTGGGGGKDKVTLVDTVVFDLQDSAAGTVTHGIQALPEGKVTIGNDLPAGTSSAIKPLVEAGEGDNHVIITAVKKDDKIALQYEATANWGAGIDLPHAAFGFSNGDKITIIGEVLDIGAADSYIQPNFRVGNEDGHGFKETAAGPFKWDITLDATMVGEIKAGSPSAIRIDGRGAGGNTVPTGQKVLITQIRIEGKRPSKLTELKAPTIALAGSVVSWEAIEGSSGYKVLSSGTEKITVKGTSIDLATANEFEYATSHTVTVIAAGTVGSTSDSKPSNAVTYDKPAKQIIGFKLKIGTTEQTVEVDAVKGTVTLLEDGNGFTFKNAVTGDNDNYGNAFATFAVDLPTGKTLNDVDTIDWTWKGIDGDIGYKTGGIRLNVGESAFTGYQSASNKFAPDLSISAAGNIELDFQFVIKTDDAAVTALTASKLYFVIYLHGDAGSGTKVDGLFPNATEYSIYDIVFTMK